jgi:hypothetical protein
VVIEDAEKGQIAGVKSNDEYNQTRAAELERLLAAKRKHLQTIPDLVNQQFEALMTRFAGSDQQTKNRMADDLHAKWQAREAEVKREIQELEEQLAVASGRLSELAVERHMLEMSSALANSGDALQPKPAGPKIDPNAESPAFTSFRQLSTVRMLSRIQGFCPIYVKNLESELSLEYLDK